MRTEGALLFCLRESLVTRLVLYLDRYRAFADVEAAAESEPP